MAGILQKLNPKDFNLCSLKSEPRKYQNRMAIENSIFQNISSEHEVMLNFILSA